MFRIRWRQHEFIFVSFSVALLLLDAFLATFRPNAIIPGLEEYQRTGVPFDHIWNYLLPAVTPVIALYVCYLLVNLVILPRWYYRKRSIPVLMLVGVGIYILLAVVFMISYRLEAYYASVNNYTGEHGRNSIRYGVGISGGILVGYLIYLFVREAMILRLEKDQRASQQSTLICNGITTTVFAYAALLTVCIVFDALQYDVIGLGVIFYLLPVLATILLNLYWLFPYQHHRNLSFRSFSWAFLGVTLILAILSYGIFTGSGMRANGLFMLSIWLVELLVAIPVSWLIYVRQREKLSAIESLQQDLGKTTADLQFLRSQVNPHFLFNALNTLYGTALIENAPRAAEGIQRLGEMMRFMLEENHRDNILLANEVKYLNNYITLQKLRIGDAEKISINVDLHVEPGELQIAPMLLIPFVENAFKHGVRLKKESWITISLTRTGSAIHFEVSNSLHAKQPGDTEVNSTGIGLENVKQRLQLLYPRRHSLQIRETDRNYFVHLDIELGEHHK